MPQLNSVIFDMDGVLVDSNEAHFLTFQKMAEILGAKPFSRDLWARSIGMHNKEIFPMWLGGGLTPERIKELADLKESMYRENCGTLLKPVAGAPELVRALKAAGHLIAVGSSGPRLNVELALRVVGVTGEFKAVVTGDDVTHGKPHPEIFLTAAARLDVDPTTCVVIEDAPQGIEAALAARMKVIGVMTTCDRDRLSRAHLVVPSLHEVNPSIVSQLFS